MERIILEVDDQVAKNWRYSSEKKRREVNSTINAMLQNAFKRNEDADFIQYIKEMQEKAAERGLTEDILNDILNEPDCISAKFYADKASTKADAIWDKKGLSDDDMDKWLN